MTILTGLRLKATSSLLEREDVIIVASVSCIYGLGSPENYKSMCVGLGKRAHLLRETLFAKSGRQFITSAMKWSFPEANFG